MSGHTLEAVLRARGLACRVEARERLAILVPDHDEATALILSRRNDALRISRANGFTHLALELVAQPFDGASADPPVASDKTPRANFVADASAALPRR